MDIVERQIATYRRNERKAVNWIFAFCMTMLVLAVVFTSIPAKSAEIEYEYGTNVFACSTALDKNGNRDCRRMGESTPRFKRLPFVDKDTGERTFEVVNAYLPVYCDEFGCATAVDMTGFRAGTAMGQGAPGHYIVESGWYISYDTLGNTVAYRMDVGPQHGQKLYGPAKEHPQNYGQEACYDTVIEQIHKDDPEAMVSMDMIKELRAACGLETKE